MSIFDRTSDGDVEDELDRVETDVVVDCDSEAAWALVSEPGWWVNDGPLGDHEVSLGDDGIYRVSDPDVGDWLIEKADEDPMDVVAFRWYPLADDELPDEYATRRRGRPSPRSAAESPSTSRSPAWHPSPTTRPRPARRTRTRSACGSRSWSRPRATSRAAELLSPRADIC